MNVAALRRIDRWCGVPLTAGLSLVRRAMDVLPLPRSRGKDGILFVKLAEQGSTVLAFPAIRRAVERVGRERVYFLVLEENRFIVDALDVIPEANVIAIDARNPAAAAVSSLRAVRRLRGLPIGAAIDMEFFARSSAIFTYLSGAAHRVGFHPFAGGGPYRGDLMTHRMIYNPHLHTAQVFYSMVEALTQPADLFPAQGQTAPDLADLPIPRHRSAADDTAAMMKLIRELTGRPEIPPLVLLNANCSDLLPLRRWPTEHYVALARRLLDRAPTLHVGFTGAPAEREDADRVAQEVGSPRAISFAGRTTLRELLALYALSRVLVTNDSGPAHFATLTPIRVVTLFGPETPRLFASPSPRNHALWSGIVCSPCVNAYNNRVTRCRDNLCMQRITVDQVLQATWDALGTTTPLLDPRSGGNAPRST